MKKILKVSGAVLGLILIVTSLILSIGFFSRKQKESKVVTTIFPIYDICRNLLGSDDDIVLLQDNGKDMHSYEATAGDMMLLSRAKLFICIGGSSDKWVGDALRSVNNVNLGKLSLMDIITKLEHSDENISQGEHDHEHDSEHEGDEHEIEYDEHIWLSVKNMIKFTSAIETKLIEVFPERTKLIEENATEYLAELTELEQEYSEALTNKSGLVLIADRFPFLYLMNDYGVDYYAAFSGCSSDATATFDTITKLRDVVNNNDLRHIFVLETSDKSIANQVIGMSNHSSEIEIVEINSCQSFSADLLSKVSYISIMQSNLENFKKVVK